LVGDLCKDWFTPHLHLLYTCLTPDLYLICASHFVGGVYVLVLALVTMEFVPGFRVRIYT
jgi:hypothetical protein